MHHLNIDLETYSDVDIRKVGAQRYISSPAFEILLFAYSFDGSPVVCVDFAQGEMLPAWVAEALASPDCIKHAYNAPFEWGCLSKYMGRQLPPEQWRCTMFHGLYCGYTAGLDATGRALGLPEDKRKLNTGKALIRYFCVPCAPSKANGGRTRNLPHHAPDRWALFKEYCCQDVTTEMEIERRLSAIPVPDFVQKEWETDLIINARGVAVDMSLVEGALSLGATVRESLMQEAMQISGLNNPNSVAQISSWLEEETGEEISGLRKDTVAKMLERDDNSPEVQRMLEIRQELGKTSTKKYDAIEQAVCPDGRVRGLLQFYGANRTGRWCLTGDHEILTPEGWVRLDDWHGGEIACWAPSTECVSFQKAGSLCFDYSGEMITVAGKRCEQVCTPDHKMPYLLKSGLWGADTADNVFKSRAIIPFTGCRVTRPSREPNALRVLIMTQADGHYTRDGDVRYHFKKERKIERCKHLLRKCEISFIERKCTDNTTSIVVKSGFVPIWLRQFKRKTFGYWLLDEPADVVFEELPHWDASVCGPNSIQYTSINETNVDVLQALASFSGRSATKSVKDRSDNPNWKSAYLLNVWNNPGHGTAIRREQVDKIAFSGKVYCAETETGYFIVRRNGKVWVTGNSGRLAQVQNLPRTYTEPLELARDLVRNRNLNALKIVYGSVPDTLSQLIRTAFIAPPGHTLIDADFSAIEARVISWLAGEEWVLEVFRTTGLIYEATASQLYGVPIDLIKKGNPEYSLRQYGKAATLALGYQGGAIALITAGHLPEDTPTEQLEDIKNRWRASNKRIVDLWYKMQSAAVQVISQGGSVGLKCLVLAREFNYEQGTDCMTITLPSGRKLYYVAPQIGQNQWGNPSISYMGMDQKTKKWKRIETYGGKLVENCVQAIARDCLAQAIDHLEAAGLPVVFHVHDEVVIDCDPNAATLEGVVKIMAQPIPWAPDLPLDADGWVGQFFKKD